MSALLGTGVFASPRSVLVVDDEPGIQRMFRAALANYGYIAEVASNGDDALVAVRKGAFDVVVCDVNLASGNGIDFLHQVRAIDRHLPVILMTGRPSPSDATRALACGAYRYLVKPLMPSTLRDIIEDAARLHDNARLASAVPTRWSSGEHPISYYAPTGEKPPI